MEGLFRDEIEITQIDKFFCNEMGRQIHRYIKAHGSMTMLESVEQRLDILPVPEREHIMSRYIDRNRKSCAKHGLADAYSTFHGELLRFIQLFQDNGLGCTDYAVL